MLFQDADLVRTEGQGRTEISVERGPDPHVLYAGLPRSVRRLHARRNDGLQAGGPRAREDQVEDLWFRHAPRSALRVAAVVELNERAREPPEGGPNTSLPPL